MCLEDVEVSIQVEVSDCDTHSSLFHAIVAQPYAALNSFLCKDPIVPVQEEQAGGGVGCDIEIRPAVVVEVRRDGSHRIGAWSLQDAAGLGNFFEGSIALVAIEIVVSERKTAWAAVHGYSFEVAVRILARPRNAVKIQIDVSRDE